jgi:tetratricopeptide (TPR) repeat protein
VLAAASVLVALGATLLALYLAKQPPTPSVTEQPGPTMPAPEVATGMPSAWPDLEIPKAAYTPPGEQPLLRGAELTTAFEQAMVAYEQNDFAAAAKQLEVVTRLEPEHAEAHFYRGVSLLLAGQSQDAIAPLKQTIQLSTGAQRESSRYYLALAYLKTNQPRQALVELQAVIQMNGQHQAVAEKLEQRLRR